MMLQRGCQKVAYVVLARERGYQRAEAMNSSEQVHSLKRRRASKCSTIC